MKFGRSLRFYFDRSLLGYFLHRVKEKWFVSPSPPKPSRINYHGVNLQLDRLSPGMQDVLLAGGYEAPEMTLVPGFICESDRVLEIGGAIGFLGLFCLKRIGVQKCTTVEPNPVTISHLKRNYELNEMVPTLIEAAIAREDGPISFIASDMFWCDSFFLSNGQSNPHTVVVEGISFGSLWERSGGDFNALIIDVEGAEQYISGRDIPECIDKIVIEIHPGIVGVRNAYRALESLLLCGFVVLGHEHNCWALARP